MGGAKNFMIEMEHELAKEPEVVFLQIRLRAAEREAKMLREHLKRRVLCVQCRGWGVKSTGVRRDGVGAPVHGGRGSGQVSAEGGEAAGGSHGELLCVVSGAGCGLQLSQAPVCRIMAANRLLVEIGRTTDRADFAGADAAL